MKFQKLSDLAANAKMPFGEHEGKLIKDLPTEYLQKLVLADPPIEIFGPARMELDRRAGKTDQSAADRFHIATPEEDEP